MSERQPPIRRSELHIDGTVLAASVNPVHKQVPKTIYLPGSVSAG